MKRFKRIFRVTRDLENHKSSYEVDLHLYQSSAQSDTFLHYE